MVKYCKKKTGFFKFYVIISRVVFVSPSSCLIFLSSGFSKIACTKPSLTPVLDYWTCCIVIGWNKTESSKSDTSLRTVPGEFANAPSIAPTTMADSQRVKTPIHLGFVVTLIYWQKCNALFLIGHVTASHGMTIIFSTVFMLFLFL